MENKELIVPVTVAEGAGVPQYATEGAAAADLTAHLDAPVTLVPGARMLVPTGVAIALPSRDFVALLFARSGLASKKGICLANGVGVIDSDYRGEVKVALVNLSQEEYVIQPGERIAQLAVMPVARARFTPVDSLDETARGAGGFGSTGRI